MNIEIKITGSGTSEKIAKSLRELAKSFDSEVGETSEAERCIEEGGDFDYEDPEIYCEAIEATEDQDDE